MTFIVISSGHGKYIRGAADILDEVNEARKVVDRVAQLLKDGGVTVKTYHDDTSHSQSENLERIVNYHNNQGNHDLDVSVHFNAYQHTSKPMGTEVLWKTQEALADKVSAAIAKAGSFLDRGQKKRTDLYFLNYTAEKAILLEVCFVDSQADADLYRRNFEAICRAIAESIGGVSIDVVPEPPEPEPPEPPEPAPEPSDEMPRPTVKKGSYGWNVKELQEALGLVVDGDFGPKTDEAVRSFQSGEGLAVDGVVGPATWGALDAQYDLPPYPPPMPPAFTPETILEICACAEANPVYKYSWNDRGRAPAGYIKGMALAYGQACLRLKMDDPAVREMAKANTGNSDTDALAWYDSAFRSLGMINTMDGRDTLRHLYVLVMGLGMRESSGEHCCGRDQSASNTSSDTAEAGLFQTSWNAHNCCNEFVTLFDQYELERSFAAPVIECPQGYLPEWSEGVSCSTSEWSCYGSGDGYTFQEICKHIPTAAVETCAVGLRNLRQHWGPINRREAELRPNADLLFQQIEVIVDALITGDIV